MRTLCPSHLDTPSKLDCRTQDSSAAPAAAAGVTHAAAHAQAGLGTVALSGCMAQSPRPRKRFQLFPDAGRTEGMLKTDKEVAAVAAAADDDDAAVAENAAAAQL